MWKKWWKLIVSAILITPIFAFSAIDVMAEPLDVKDRMITMPKKLIEEEVAVDTNVIPLVTEDQVLEGLIDNVESYYEVPIQGLLDGNYIDLSLKYSNLLLEASTVTIYVDETPIESIPLDSNKTSMEVKIALEGHAIEPGFHNVSVSFYGQIEENICVNEENPANWLAILSESSIYLQPKEVEARDDALGDFPYPFIQQNKVQSKIIVPNDASEEILAAALKVSNYVNKQASNEHSIEIVREQEIDHISTHLSVIGNVDDWDGAIKDMISSSDVKVEPETFNLQTFFMDFSNKTKQLLFVTAKDDHTINDNISMLTDDFFVKQLTGNGLSVSELPTREEEEQNNKVEFTDFNMSDISLSGNNQKSIYYFYTIPTFVDKSQAATLHMKMKVSETLFHRDQLDDLEGEAELVIFINEEPYSIRINDLEKTEDNSVYEVSIPVDSNTFKDDPYISLQFQANGLKNRDFCAKPTDTHWIYILEDSFIELGIQIDEHNDSFRTWPSPFVASDKKVETAIILPDKLDDSLVEQLQFLIHQLGAHANINGIKFIKATEVDDETLIKNNIIVVADKDVYGRLFAENEEVLLRVNGADVLQVEDFGFISETARAVTWIQPSIWNNEKAMAVFSPIHLSETSTIIGKNINEFLTDNVKFANVIVENANGEVFTNELQEQNAEENVKEEETGIFIKEIEGNRWIPYVFGGLMVLSIIIFIIASRRRRRKRINRE